MRPSFVVELREVAIEGLVEVYTPTIRSLKLDGVTVDDVAILALLKLDEDWLVLELTCQYVGYSEVADRIWRLTTVKTGLGGVHSWLG